MNSTSSVGFAYTRNVIDENITGGNENGGLARKSRDGWVLFVWRIGLSKDKDNRCKQDQNTADNKRPLFSTWRRGNKRRHRRSVERRRWGVLLRGHGAIIR